MYTNIRKSTTVLSLLITLFASFFTGYQAFAQGDDDPRTIGGTGHWDWTDWPPPPNGCPTTVINISTGVDNTGTLLSIGSPDPNWSCPSGMGNTITPISSWGSLPGSRWLGSTSSTSPGYFNYVRAFSLPVGAVGTITFQALADNYVQIYLDGGTSPIAQTPGLTIYGFTNANVVNYTALIGPGVHYITAVVYNGNDVTGLNLSGTVSYNIPNTSLDLSTGISNYLPLAIGLADVSWPCSPAGYNNVTAPNAAWGNFSGSQWLGIGGTDAPAGNYTYDRTFTVPSGGGQLTFEAMADNYVQFYLDGSTTPFAQTPGLTLYGFMLSNKVAYSAPIGAGSHTLHAKVYNNGAYLGFNLHGSMAYCNPDYDNTSCNADPNYTVVHTGYNTASFYSSTNPINTSSAYAGVTHYWDFGDGGNSTLANPVYTYAAPGSYLVTHTITKVIISPDGVKRKCIFTASCYLTVDDANRIFSFDCQDGIPSGKPAALGILPELTEAFTIFPNPAQDNLKISRRLNSCELEIIGLDGRSMLHVKDFNGTDVDISSLPDGSYILRIIEGNQVTNLKFNKM